MPYYHDLVTRQSWQVLQDWRQKFNFILIGGWAVWLYTKGLKSKDIDLIVDHVQLSKIKRQYDLNKNARLKKYETKAGQISVDIYVDYYSDLGVRVEAIRDHTQLIEGFTVPSQELLVILKQTAWSNRKLSIKGRKDMIDIISLVQAEFSWSKYFQLIKQYKLESYIYDLEKLIKNQTEIKELNLNKHQYSRLKKTLILDLQGQIL